MAKARILTQELRIGEFDDDELTTVLTSVLPRGAQFRPNEFEYRTMADEWIPSLHYRDGKIMSATAGSAITADHLQQIKAEVDRVLATAGGRKVARRTMFSTRPVEGSWRYRDQFQIVPAPPEAPRPSERIAQHPFLVDFVFNDSPSSSLQRIRYIRQATDLMLVLNLLLVHGITAPSSRGRKHWVWAPLGSTPAVVWAGEGYMIPNFHYLVDDLPESDALPLEDMPADAYFDRSTNHGDKLKVPSELSDLLDAFHALSNDDRDRFLRACYWYHTAATVWEYSQSLHLASLINSIECLSSVGPQRSEPEGPSALFKAFMKKFAPHRPALRPAPGPSALFRSIMRRFAPGSPSRTLLDKIYDARSKITHGERLLYLDQPPVAAALNQVSTSDRDIGDAATILCRGPLTNWLWNTAGRGPGQLVTRGLPVEKPARAGTKSGMTVTVPGVDAE
jgi:hypothetical protein